MYNDELSKNSHTLSSNNGSYDVTTRNKTQHRHTPHTRGHLSEEF